jgi:hypothetical protein
MIGLLKKLTILFLFTSVMLIGCAGEKVPIEPPSGTGTVFQRTLVETQIAVKNALNKANFGIKKDSPEYIEAIHLKPGETVEKSDGELVGIWFKDRGNSVVILIDTMKNTSEVATQIDWEKPLLAAIMQELK